MKPLPDAMERWRDRPPGGASDEDRAGTLVRDTLRSGVLDGGLDDRQLALIAQNMKGVHRAPPPLWLRPVVVALLLIFSVASVMGYQAGWLAPLRDWKVFRSIPPAPPSPAEHERKRAARGGKGHAGEMPAHLQPPAPPEAPAPALPPPVSAPAPGAPAVTHPIAARPTAPPVRRVALAESPPRPAPPADPGPEPTAASEEIRALERAVSLLRGKHDAPAALAALDDYVARFPAGVMVREARVARVDALLMLDRADEALRALEVLPLDEHRRSTELQLIRGELRARTDCGRADADFTAVLARVRTATLEERALWGRASCRSKQGNVKGAAEDLRRYLNRFPQGPHADWGRRWLENN